MNFLAHAYLSFGNDELIVGNLIADTIKGKQSEDYPPIIREGIMLHRQIDEYTDNHPVVKEAKSVFNHSVGRYDGSFLDVSYDHFLSLNKEYEPNDGWHTYAITCYKALEKYAEILPSRFCNMFMYMRSEDWLSNYGNIWMIQRSFERLQRRAKYLDGKANPFQDFENNYNILKESFELFFPDLKGFVEEKLRGINNIINEL